MYKRVIYIVKSDLSFYPPCMSQIRMIKDLGVQIEVWFGSSKDTAKDILRRQCIHFTELVDPHLNVGGKIDTLNNWTHFRKAVLDGLRREPKDYLVWFGTAESVLPLYGALAGIPYVVTALELCDDQPIKEVLLASVCRKAIAVTCCELNRAYYMKIKWGLNSLPSVFPNKPYGLNAGETPAVSISETKSILDELDGKRFLLYQGLFQRPEYVAPIAEALNMMKSDYAFVLMGKDRYGTTEIMKKIYPNTFVYGFVPAPKHLEITARARIGVVLYDDTSLNKAFCAPNKIYEYAAFGLPTLANRLPGLVSTVEASGSGKCVDFEPNLIAEAIESIDQNYDRFRSCAYQFFNNTNNLDVMKLLLCKLDILIKAD